MNFIKGFAITLGLCGTLLLITLLIFIFKGLVYVTGNIDTTIAIIFFLLVPVAGGLVHWIVED